jgi:hypothetical protein
LQAHGARKAIDSNDRLFNLFGTSKIFVFSADDMHVGTDITCLMNTGFVSILQNRDGQGCSFCTR